MASGLSISVVATILNNFQLKRCVEASLLYRLCHDCTMPTNVSHVSSRIRSAIIDMKCGYYLRAATITFRLYYMWHLIEGGYYSMCGVYSRKCGGIFMLTSNRCSSTVHLADTNTY